MKIDEKEKKRIIEMILKGYTNVEISAQKEAEDAKAQQGVQEDDTELTVEDLD